MSLSFKTLKMLWGRAAGRCSYPGCRVDVFFDESEADTPTLVGENCHIVAESDSGPRADPSMPIDQRNSYSNLILMCRNHHKVIDDTENGEKYYSVERLHEIKQEHEAWVRNQLGVDAQKQEDDEYYAQIVEGWENLCHVDTWYSWSSSILSHGQPSMDVAISNDLKQASQWLLNRVWPKRYVSLENSFKNFRVVLDHFHNNFLNHAETKRDMLFTKKFYKIPEWNERKYNYLLNEYNDHVDLTQDLLLELTRAANLICDEIRRHLMRSYRRKEGHLVVCTGPDMDFSFTSLVVHYSAEERSAPLPFKNLKYFKKNRINRDVYFGDSVD